MSRIVATLGIAALICAASMACSVDASPGASGSVKLDAELPGVIAVPVDYEGQVPGALILAESVRSFGGDFSDVPIRLFIPSRLAPMIAGQREKLANLRVGVSEVAVPEEAFSYILGAKPFLAAQAEQDAGDAAFLAILAPNTIVLQYPVAFDLPQGIALGYSTVHHQNIGSAASEPLDEFWSRLYEVLDVQNDDVFTNETLADRVTVRFYCNAGSFVVRPEEQLLQAWATAFSKLVRDPAIRELCAKGPRNVFLHQAALAGVVLKRLRPSQTLRLPDTYSYPLFFEKFHDVLLTFDSLEDVVTMRYEFRFEDLPVGWQHQVEGSPEVIAWVSKRLEG